MVVPGETVGFNEAEAITPRNLLCHSVPNEKVAQLQ